MKPLKLQDYRTLVRFLILILGCAVAIRITEAQQPVPQSRIDLDQAIQLALAHNHALKAAESQVPQSQAEEITAAIRPNPVFTYDDLYVPVFSPSQLNTSTLDTVTEFDVGFGYTFERGHKRQARIVAAKDQTAQTRSQVNDTQRTLRRPSIITPRTVVPWGDVPARRPVSWSGGSGRHSWPGGRPSSARCRARGVRPSSPCSPRRSGRRPHGRPP